MTQEEREEQLAAIKRELARQDEEWARVKRALVALGNVEITVPRWFTEALERINTRNGSRHLGLRA